MISYSFIGGQTCCHGLHSKIYRCRYAQPLSAATNSSVVKMEGPGDIEIIRTQRLWYIDKAMKTVKPISRLSENTGFPDLYAVAFDVSNPDHKQCSIFFIVVFSNAQVLKFSLSNSPFIVVIEYLDSKVPK